MNTDDPNAYGTNWYSAGRVASPERGPLNVELDVDVCVIGAGLAGLTVAREVARLGWSVVVLEAQSVGWSASGRNPGVVLPGFPVDAHALVARVGLDHAKALWKASETGAEYVRNAAREMAGASLAETGWLHISNTDDPAAMASTAALMVGEFGAAVEPWPVDRVRESLRSPRYFHALHYPRGFSINPLNYALGLAAAAEAAGVRIFENTPATEIDPAGVRKRVVTQQSRVRAGHVVLAGNVHYPDLVPQFSSALTPAFSTAIVTEPLGGALADAIGFAGAVSDSNEAGCHYRIVDGNRLMWAGRASVWPGKPQTNALMRQIKVTYPQLRDAKAEYAWTAVAGNTVHGMPQIGEISPGLWLLSGFGGHGLNTTAMAGEMVARAIVESNKGWQLFTPFALVWAGGKLGRFAQQLADWEHRSRESLDGLLARRRETKRLRAEAARAAAVASPPVVPEPPPPEPVPVVEPLVQPVAEPVMAEIEPTPVALPAVADIESAPAAPVEEKTYEVTEGQSGGAAPPIPEAADEVTEPVKPKRAKRGPKKRKRKADAPDNAPPGESV